MVKLQPEGNELDKIQPTGVKFSDKVFKHCKVVVVEDGKLADWDI